jgi:hypothetical protein
MNVPTNLEDGKKVNIPIDVTIMPKDAKPSDLPLFLEAKSAGDFTNVNKRRKEEAMKMALLRRTHGMAVRFNLFLCGYFDSGYLGYEAAEKETTGSWSGELPPSSPSPGSPGAGISSPGGFWPAPLDAEEEVLPEHPAKAIRNTQIAIPRPTSGDIINRLRRIHRRPVSTAMLRRSVAQRVRASRDRLGIRTRAVPEGK